ncbi:hypothetical protein RvY_01100-2 [Ramazzottius varieornatus]|nr:hypothetical protein RvY_01100-2 [Ramazzottius varieornatus]
MATNIWNFIRNKTQHQEQSGKLKPTKDLFTYKKTLQHGFPNRPSALGYDPRLNIFAIGTRSGNVKLYGAPGVECYGQHKNEQPVSHIVFLPGQGRFVTICEDNTLYLWEINSRSNHTTVECVNETAIDGRQKKISAVWLSSFNEQLYLGVESGDVLVLNINAFEFAQESVIYLDAATQSASGVARATPGAVEALAEHPADPDQVLIGYSKGLLVLWDLREKRSISSFWAAQQLESVCWNADGSRFFSSHNDGSYFTWEPSKPNEPAEKASVVYGPFPCKPIPKYLWRASKESESFQIFSGGMPRSRYGDHHTVSVMQGDKHVVYDFTSKVVDFFTIGDSEDTRALVVLLEEELIAVDLTTPKWPIFQLPYLFVIHSSSITCSSAVDNVPSAIWTSIVNAGKKQLHGSFSAKPWPVNGGVCHDTKPTENGLLLTGHEDGSVRFWDVSGAYLKLVYTLTTSNFFKTYEDDEEEEETPEEHNDDDEGDEWPPFRKVGSFDPYSDDPRLAVQRMEFCTKNSVLLVAGTAGQIVLFDFKKTAVLGMTVDHLLVNIVGDRDGFVWKGHNPLKLKSSVIKSDVGFQPQMVVQTMPPATCSALTLQSDWHLFGVGTAHGFFLMDYMRKQTVTSRCTLSTLDVNTGADTSMNRRGKSLKKSLRESFRRIRRGRSQMDIKRNGAAGDKATRHIPIHEEETRPVERQVEARSVDNEMASVVRCLQLCSCHILNNVVRSPTFWVGTNNGTVYIYNLVLPLSENRREEDVHASPSKEIQLRHHAPVVYICVIDAFGCPVNDKANAKDVSGDGSMQKVLICSEEQFKIFHLPTLRPINKFKLTAHEGSQLRKAKIVNYSASHDDDVHDYCLTCLTNQGDVVVFSLPNLVRLLKQDLIRREDIHGISTLVLTKTGQGYFQKSPSEFQRFTLSSRKLIEPLFSIELDENARSSQTPRPHTNPPSRMSESSRTQSPRLTSLKGSPESGISVNNSMSTHTRTTTGLSPDTNLNESLRSETSATNMSVDSVRVFS